VARTEVVKTRRRDIMQKLQVRQLNHLAKARLTALRFRSAQTLAHAELPFSLGKGAHSL
jgi:hypothetical protein